VEQLEVELRATSDAVLGHARFQQLVSEWTEELRPEKEKKVRKEVKAADGALWQAE
jgi:hypothetical protein